MAFSNCPARPTNGSPCRSSSAPGASPMTIQRAVDCRRRTPSACAWHAGPQARHARTAASNSVQPRGALRAAPRPIRVAGETRAMRQRHRRREQRWSGHRGTTASIARHVDVHAERLQDTRAWRASTIRSASLLRARTAAAAHPAPRPPAGGRNRRRPQTTRTASPADWIATSTNASGTSTMKARSGMRLAVARFLPLR